MERVFDTAIEEVINGMKIDLQKKRIGVVFIKEQIDYPTSADKLMFTMLGAIVEFDRDLINERTKEGKAGAKD